MAHTSNGDDVVGSCSGLTYRQTDPSLLVLADSERIIGDGHPNTQTFRANLTAMTGRSPDTASP